MSVPQTLLALPVEILLAVLRRVSSVQPRLVCRTLRRFWDLAHEPEGAGTTKRRFRAKVRTLDEAATLLAELQQHSSRAFCGQLALSVDNGYVAENPSHECHFVWSKNESAYQTAQFARAIALHGATAALSACRLNIVQHRIPRRTFQNQQNALCGADVAVLATLAPLHDVAVSDVTPRELCALAWGLARCPTLRHLSLHDTDTSIDANADNGPVDAARMEDAFAELAVSTNLTTLRLDSILVGQQLLRALRSAPALRKLMLQDVAIEDSICETMASGYSCLESLDLDRCEISSVGACALATLSSLVHLYVHYSNDWSDGTRALVRHPALETLILSCSGATADDALVFMRAAPPMLRVLRIEYEQGGIDDETARALWEAECALCARGVVVSLGPNDP